MYIVSKIVESIFAAKTEFRARFLTSLAFPTVQRTMHATYTHTHSHTNTHAHNQSGGVLSNFTGEKGLKIERFAYYYCHWSLGLQLPILLAVLD